MLISSWTDNKTVHLLALVQKTSILSSTSLRASDGLTQEIIYVEHSAQWERYSKYSIKINITFINVNVI